MAKVGNAVKKAVLAHKNDETTFSGGASLPGGIENGVAQLDRCYFGTYEKGDNAGQKFFMASGVVVHPTEHNGFPLIGLRTQIGPEAVCDTPNATSRKTIDQHVEWILNEMRKLGYDTRQMTGDEDLEDIAASIQAAAPTFRFRTWQGRKETTGPYAGQEPRVNHDWRGHCAWNPETGAADAVLDETAPADPSNPPFAASEPEAAAETEDLDSLLELAEGGKSEAQQKIAAIGKQYGVDTDVAETWGAAVESIRAAMAASEQEGTADEPAADEPDYNALAAAADNGNQSAADALSAKAIELGLDPNDGDAYPNWTDLGKAVAEAAGEGEAAEPAAYVPAIGDVIFHTPPKAKKPVECQILAVFSASETVNLKNLDDGKTVYKAVPFAALQEGV